MAALLKIFMGLALVHFQKYWLLKGTTYLGNLIQPTMMTGLTPFFRSGQPHKPSFLQSSRCQAVWMQLSVNIAILLFILYSPIHYSIFLEEIFIIDLEF